MLCWLRYGYHVLSSCSRSRRDLLLVTSHTPPKTSTTETAWRPFQHLDAHQQRYANSHYRLHIVVGGNDRRTQHLLSIHDEDIANECPEEYSHSRLPAQVTGLNGRPFRSGNMAQRERPDNEGGPENIHLLTVKTGVFLDKPVVKREK